MEGKSREWAADESERGRRRIRRIKQKRSYMLHHANNGAFWCVFVCVAKEKHILHGYTHTHQRKASDWKLTCEGGWNQYTHVHLCMRTKANQPCVLFPSLLVPRPHCCSCCYRYCWWTQFLLGWGNIAVRMKRHIHIKLHATDRWPSLSRIHFIACVRVCVCMCVCLGGVEICRSESKIQVHVVHDFILVHNVADLKTLLFIFTWMLKVFTHKCCGARWLAFIAGVVCSPFGCAHIPRKKIILK